VGLRRSIRELIEAELNEAAVSGPGEAAALGRFGSRSHAKLSPNMGDDNAVSRGIQPEVDPICAGCVSDM